MANGKYSKDEEYVVNRDELSLLTVGQHEESCLDSQRKRTDSVPSVRRRKKSRENKKSVQQK